MIYQQLLRQLVWIILAIVLTGCAAPTGTPVILATSHPTLAPTQIFIAMPTFAPTPVKASSEEGIIFSRTYGGTTTHNTGQFITSTRDGGYLITGKVNYGCWVLKLNASGEKEWQSSFEQEIYQELRLHGTGFSCVLARQTPDDGYMIMGIGYIEGRGSQTPFFLITLDHEGNWVAGQVIAEKAGKIPYLDHDGNLIHLTSLGTSGRVTETIDGGYIIVSQYPERSENSSTHMTKTDKYGNYIWDRNLCLDKNIQQAVEKKIVCARNSYNYIWDVIQLQEGGFVVTGDHYGGWLLKTDVNGNVEWIQSYLGRAGHALIQLADGGFLIAGAQHPSGVLIKTDSRGNMQWSRLFDDGIFIGMEQGLNAEIIVMGWAHSSAGWDETWFLGLDSTLLK